MTPDQITHRTACLHAALETTLTERLTTIRRAVAGQPQETRVQDALGTLMDWFEDEPDCDEIFADYVSDVEAQEAITNG